jgi:hypothetical protein
VTTTTVEPYFNEYGVHACRNCGGRVACETECATHGPGDHTSVIVGPGKCKRSDVTYYIHDRTGDVKCN